jgi:hypothetical protein
VTPTGNVISFDHDELVDSSAEQYPIVSAELEFDFDDNRVGVVFEGDTLSIDSPTDHVNSRVLENFDWAFATEFGNEY